MNLVFKVCKTRPAPLQLSFWSCMWQSDSFSFACSLCQSQNISTFASVTRRLGAVTISLLKRSVGCLAVGCRGWRGRQDSTGQWDTPCDRLEPLRIRWSLTLLGLTRSSFSIPGQSTWLEQCEAVGDGFTWGVKGGQKSQGFPVREL